MVSYKKLYEDLKKSLKTVPIKSDYLCPICGKDLLESGGELYCSDESCTYDKTFDDLLGKLESYGYLERRD